MPRARFRVPGGPVVPLLAALLSLWLLTGLRRDQAAAGAAAILAGLAVYFLLAGAPLDPSRSDRGSRLPRNWKEGT